MRLQALFLVLLWPVCAPLMQNPAGGEGAKKFQEAETDFEQDKYGEAHATYRACGKPGCIAPRRRNLTQRISSYTIRIRTRITVGKLGNSGNFRAGTPQAHSPARREAGLTY